MQRTFIGTATLVAALATANAAQALSYTFTDSLLVVIADGSPDTSFSAANDNLPDGDRVSIDSNTGDYGGGWADALLSFDDFLLPAGSVVEKAELEFFTKSFTNGPVRVYGLAMAFDNTTSVNSLGPDENGIFEPGVIQGDPNSDYTSQSNIADEAAVAFDVTDIVADWAAGGMPYGFGIYNESGDGWDFQVITDGDEFSPRLHVELANVAPVPVPLPALLLLSGIVGLVGLRRFV